jgi:hypothetical protein
MWVPLLLLLFLLLLLLLSSQLSLLCLLLHLWLRILRKCPALGGYVSAACRTVWHMHRLHGCMHVGINKQLMQH